MSPAKKSQAARGAYLLAAAAVRAEVKKLSKLSKAGVAVDPEQHAVLSGIAEQLQLHGIADAPPELLELFATARRKP